MDIMSSPRIVVVGSANTDLVVGVLHIPAPGETVLGGDLQIVAGGKGANQAVAAARLGAQVTFIARVGDDAFGQTALENFVREGIATDFVRVTPGVASGVALIAVREETGENAIVVAPGA
ncbi:MAG: PfkB family carbohydrate kinase, partial [bacterium]